MDVFKSNNPPTDTHQDFKEHHIVPGSCERRLVYNDKKGPKPWFTKNGIYILLTFLTLSWY